jgi:hypothetical protein
MAQAYDYAIGQQVAVIPMLFPITTWAMRKGIVCNGFPQEATVASLAHEVKVMRAEIQVLCDAVDRTALMRHVGTFGRWERLSERASNRINHALREANEAAESACRS